MSFWSHQTLVDNLTEIIPNGETPKVDANSIELTLASEVYISPSWVDKAPRKKTIEKYEEDYCFTIPPGQFGFLQTAEDVKIPTTVMGFISLKSSIKMLGLVNVSGFHVDPGWNGPLTFAVFNAGPSPVHLKVGMDLFLLWIAGLDHETEEPRTKRLADDHFLETVNKVSGSVNSGYDLQAKLEQLDKKVSNYITAFFVILALLTSIAGGLILLGMSGQKHPSHNLPIEVENSETNVSNNEPQQNKSSVEDLKLPETPDE